jgi:hypothetical protein
MVYQLITVTQTALTKQLVEEVMITVMLRLTSIQTTLSQLTLKGLLLPRFTVLVLLTVLL